MISDSENVIIQDNTAAWNNEDKKLALYEQNIINKFAITNAAALMISLKFKEIHKTYKTAYKQLDIRSVLLFDIFLSNSLLQ